MVLRRQLVVIDAVDKGTIDVLLARRRNDDFLRAASDMRAGLGFRSEQASAFEYHIDAKRTPRQLGRIALGEHLDLVSFDDEIAAIDADLTRKAPVRGVVLGQMRIGFGIAEIVYRDNLNLVCATGLVQCA